MLGREQYETRFQGGTEIRGFNQIKKFLRHITPQNNLYCFSEKQFLGLGASTQVSLFLCVQCLKVYWIDLGKCCAIFLDAE